jgi:2'-5' RNA ligase
VPWDAPGSTAIVVLAPEAETVVGRLYGAHSRAGAEGMSPHVTLLVPFVPASQLGPKVQGRLVRLFRRFEPFDYCLRRFQRFGDGVVYLAPEPPEPFVALVEALVEEFPDYLPYEGVHETIVPHLTVAQVDDKEIAARVVASVEPHLPLACHAGEATLVERGADLRWSPREKFPLG